MKSLSSRVRCARRGCSGRTRGAAAGHVANRTSTMSIQCVVPARRDAGSHRALAYSLRAEVIVARQMDA
eukprot:6195688-Pleurochrysis_carterae.AAC.4